MIRRSVIADHRWITDLSALVYGELGDYSTIIPAWLEHPGVLSYLDEQHDRRGFIILGFFEEAGTSDRRCIADLLAIAVEPHYQRRGIGRRLLDFAIRVAAAASDPSGVAEIRLTVPENNAVGQRLYTSTGFEVLDPEYGAYDGGQRAIRMTKRLRAG